MMKGRSFFKTTALGGSVVALSGITACVQDSAVQQKMESGEFPHKVFVIILSIVLR
nr:hypothetical protein [uncultured Draconibacterium sp.]